MSVREKDLETVPEPDALFGPVGAALADPKSYVGVEPGLPGVAVPQPGR